MNIFLQIINAVLEKKCDFSEKS